MRALALATMTTLAATAAAEPLDGTFDRQLAEAAATIAASRMGPLRGGFEPGDTVALSRAALPPASERPAVRTPPTQGTPPSARRRPVWVNGLAIARERRTTVSPEL